MAKSQFFTLGGIDFEGRTKTEAKDAAMEAAAQAFTGDYVPRILTYRNQTLIVYREARSGWLYRILDSETFTDGKVLKTEAFYCSTPESLHEALKRGIEHLVQRTWTYEDGISVPNFVQLDDSRREMESWMKFQLRFKYFAEQGYNRNTCHQMACEPSRYECPVG